MVPRYIYRMTANRFAGGCHCGNLSFVFEATAPLESLGLRACMCSFCRAHGARNTSDPNGTIRISVRDGDALDCNPTSRFVHFNFGDNGNHRAGAIRNRNASPGKLGAGRGRSGRRTFLPPCLLNCSQ